MSAPRDEGAAAQPRMRSGTTRADALRAVDAVEAALLSAFDTDAWLDYAVRAEEPAVLGDLAGYRLVRAVSRGARATVFEAVEPQTGRRVAIKQLHGGDAGRDAAQASHALPNVTHPNIVLPFAATEADGARLLVTEWVDGKPLDRWADGVRGARRPVEARRAIVGALVETARAVAVGHAVGAVHGGLKPSNVLVGADGVPKVLDFGVVTAAGATDARADVHALGLLAYRTLTGRSAFDQTLEADALPGAVRHAVPAFTADDKARVPRDLELVILRALERDPAQRYADASAFADDLERFLAGKPVEARPAGVVAAARELALRQPGAAIAIAAAVVVVIAVTLVAAVVVAMRAVSAG